MSVAERPADEIIDPLCEDESIAEPRTRIHSYAETGTGVHAIPLGTAIGAIHRHRDGKPQPGDPPLVWIDIAAPGAPEGEFLRTELHFHPLAVEDTAAGSAPRSTGTPATTSW